MKKNASLLLTIVTLCCLCPLQALASQQQLTLLIHPFLPPPELYKKFTPLVDYLSKETGKRIDIKISQNYQQHIDSVGKDQMDLAYMGPVAYVEMTKKYGDKPALACQEVNGKTFLHGMIIVKADSSINTLAELAGKRLAFVDRESTMGYVLPIFMLQEAGVKENQLAQGDFLKSHTNVALGVLNGFYEAGAVKDETYDAYKERGLKMLAKSPPIQEHIIVANPQMPESLVATLRESLLKLKDKPILTAIQSTLTGFVPVKDADYNTLRQVMQTINQADK